MAMAWFVARTRPTAEHGARDHLEAKGIECFLPAVYTTAPRREREDVPLFPGYLFIKYDLEQRGATALRQVPELVGVVTFEGVAPSVPDEVIQELRQRVADINGSGGFWMRYRQGDRVLIRLGSQGSESLAEVEVDTTSPQSPIQVIMTFMGRLARAEVPRQSVRAVQDGMLCEDQRSFRHHRRTRGRGRYLFGIAPRALEIGRSST
jgi:transcriptional antiterminator RfaH